jgi:uncharacterized membrane protein YphA (DoxX/SURF4 family)
MENHIAQLKRIKHFQLLTVLFRYLLGSAFVWASIFKIMGIRFTPQSGEHAPIHSLPHLLESMYRTGYFWSFIGWGQLIAGFLIMSQAFSTLGAVVYLPIIFVIFFMTTAFESPTILVFTTLMLLANIYLLLWDWNRLKFMVILKPSAYVDQTSPFLKCKFWTYMGLFLGIAISVFRIFIAGNISK